MKPLTIEELKALEIGDWVWIEYAAAGRRFYAMKFSKSEGDVFDIVELPCVLYYSDYDKTWLAYKNKEQAEMSNEIKRFAEYIGSKIAGHSNYHGDDILSAIYCASEGKNIEDIKPLEADCKRKTPWRIK